MLPFRLSIADNFDAALAEYSESKSTLIAGGIDLLDQMKEQILTPESVLSIGRLTELNYIRVEDDGVHIGSGCTLADISRHDLLAREYRGFHHSAAKAATPQIRERATVGGNLCQRPRCWYFRNSEFDCLKKGGYTCFAVEGENRYHAVFGEGPCHIVHPSNIAPALVALDAVIVVNSTENHEQRYPVVDFFKMPHEMLYSENLLRPGQIISEVVLPKRPSHSASIEFREKQSFDWPLVSCCVARIDKKWRVCLGGVAPIPWLSHSAMKVLGDKDVTPELAALAGDAAVEGADPMSDNDYKLAMIKVATKRSLLAASGIEVPA